jgi:hypothetical protein
LPSVNYGGGADSLCHSTLHSKGIKCSNSGCADEIARDKLADTSVPLVENHRLHIIRHRSVDRYPLRVDSSSWPSAGDLGAACHRLAVLLLVNTRAHHTHTHTHTTFLCCYFWLSEHMIIAGHLCVLLLLLDTRERTHPHKHTRAHTHAHHCCCAPSRNTCDRIRKGQREVGRMETAVHLI